MRNIVFIISSDTQLEIAKELKRSWQDVKTWIISTRQFYFSSEYDSAHLEKSFDIVLTPRSIRAGIWARLAARVLKKMALTPIAERLLQPRPLSIFPQLFRRGGLSHFDFVFVLNDRSFPEIELIELFQVAGVPVGLIQESIRRDDSTDVSTQWRWNGQGGCDVIYAWGQTSMEYYLRAGVAAERIITTGSPRIDSYIRQFAQLPPQFELKKSLGLPTDRPLVLIATNPVYSMGLRRPLVKAAYIHALSRALDWVGQIGAYALVKPHQSEMQEFESLGLPAWIGSFGHATYGQDTDLVQAIKASDAVLVFNSTVALEAALLGKPSGLLAANEYGHGTDFLETGISRMVNSSEDLEALIATNGNGSWTNCVHRYLIDTSGSARSIMRDAMSRMKPELGDTLHK